MQESEAIILRTYRLGEADKVCVALTREAGKVRGVMRRPRRQLWRNGAFEEPFSRVRLEIYGREGQPLVRLRPVELIESAFGRAVEPRVLAFLSYAAELLDGFIPEGEPCEVHYRLTKALIAAVRPDAIEDLRLYLEVWLLRLAGLLPNLRACSRCGAALVGEGWLAADGTPLCAGCGGGYGDYLGGAARGAWAQVLGHAPNELPPLEAGAREVLSPIMSRLIRRAIEREPNSLRSWAHYRSEK